MKEIKWHTFLKFFAVWLCLLFSSNVFESLNKLPMGVHQSAQCDRASIAQNYYLNGFHFMYPEINETRCVDGIVSCELPLTAFLAACLYKVFSHDVFWFRLLSLIFAGIGLFALFLLLRRYIHELLSLFVVLLLQFSPIVLFYTANFLPDITSLGLVLSAWALFIFICLPHPYLPNIQSTASKIVFAIVLGLSIAVKTTSFIQWCTMFGLVLLSFVPFFKLKIHNKKQVMFLLLGALIVPIAWWFWSQYLAANHNSEYFMMRVPWIGLESYKNAWHVYLANWPQETFSKPLNKILFPLLLLPLLLKKWIQNEWYFLYLLNLMGSVFFIVVMMEQFKYHDYYIICLLPVFAFAFLTLALAANQLPKKMWYLKILGFVLVFWAMFFQVESGAKNFNERYTEGSYWEQSHVRSIDYDSLRLSLPSLGIDSRSCTVVGYDISPNNILYLLQLRGHRISKDHSLEWTQGIINGSKPSFLISNDTAFTQVIAPMVDTMLLLKTHKNLTVYRLKYEREK